MTINYTTLNFILLILSILVAIVTLMKYFINEKVQPALISKETIPSKFSNTFIVPKSTSKTMKGATFTNQNDGRLYIKFFPEIGLKDILILVEGPTFIADYSFKDSDLRCNIIFIDSNGQLTIEIIER